MLTKNVASYNDLALVNEVVKLYNDYQRQFLIPNLSKVHFGGELKLKSIKDLVEVVRFLPSKWASLRFGTRIGQYM